MGYPPRTISQLATEANNYEFTSSVSFRSWIHVAKTILRQAEIYRLDNSYEEAYVLYSRFADLVINHLPRHPSISKSVDNKQLKSLMKDVEESLGYMSQLKPIIEENFNKYKRIEEYKLKRHLLNRQHQEEQQRRLEESQKQTEKLNFSSDWKSQNNSRSSSLSAGLNGGLTRDSIGSTRDSIGSSSHDSSITLGRNSSDNLIRNASDALMRNSSAIPSKESIDSDFTNAIANLKKLRTPDTISSHTTNPLSISKSWYPSVESNRKDDQDIPPTVPPKGPLDIKPPTGVEHRIRATTESGAPLRSVFISENLRHEFLRIAEPNTRQNLETCGILCGKLNRNAFFVTHLVIPPQYSTSDTCSTTDEEVLFEFVDSRELFILGWIHTHPTQSCFLSSIDLHTQNSYQIMLPEAVAVVCAPTQEPSWGVFRLTDPPGIDIIKACKLSSTFHPHPEPNIYRPAIPGHVSFKSQLKFHIKDLRKV